MDVHLVLIKSKALNWYFVTTSTSSIPLPLRNTQGARSSPIDNVKGVNTY
jgi:hypothetical protein